LLLSYFEIPNCSPLESRFMLYLFPAPSLFIDTMSDTEVLSRLMASKKAVLSCEFQTCWKKWSQPTLKYCPCDLVRKLS